MTKDMRPCDRLLWESECAEPTPREETLQLVEHANIDGRTWKTLEYARRQLSNIRICGCEEMDFVLRALDALDRAADAHACIVIAQGNQEPTASAKEIETWTAEEILQHAG